MLSKYCLSYRCSVSISWLSRFDKLVIDNTVNYSIFSETVRDIILSNKMVVHGQIKDDDIASDNEIEVSDTVFVSTANPDSLKLNLQTFYASKHPWSSGEYLIKKLIDECNSLRADIEMTEVKIAECIKRESDAKPPSKQTRCPLSPRTKFVEKPKVLKDGNPDLINVVYSGPTERRKRAPK